MKANYKVSISININYLVLIPSWFKFSNLCGSVYRQGNILFTADGNSILSPVGNRVTVFDLVQCV